MKKVLTLVAFAGMLTFVACGPSAEEVEKKNKAIKDSIAAVQEKAKADSVAAVNVAKEKAKADSLNMAMEKMKADSIAKAEEGGKKGGKKK